MLEKEFFKKIKQHCKEVNQLCTKCRFRDFCYCVPANYSEELLDASIDRLSSE